MEPSPFFSFLSDEPRADTRQPPTDDFLAHHVISPVSDPHGPSQPTSNVQSVVPDTPDPPQPTNNDIHMQSDEAVHPLIRNRRLETPEEIAAWIAERKSKYPTDANMQLKAANDKPESGAKRKLNSMNPLSALAGYGAGSDSDEPQDSSDASDGSESDSSNGSPAVASAKAHGPRAPFRASGIAPHEDRRKLRVCKFYARGSCTKGTRCAFSHPESAAPVSVEPSVEPRPTSLLAKLLAKDIDRENYRVWQCIDYLCRTNLHIGT
ncbi:hypothetical protein LPJ77_004364 [Coemansia sp. RSA 2523]|nr:hypothetical protein LPJ58_001436 [Coemansia sp. RSA 1591]KAJ1765203.1 hypothetical protein LPJ69_001406 [Coemansia sp. RSA 1752]KAJ1774751.1 hypothetical protein LPJ54_004103 [Coemansia sp. RSA 1824]KAJ1793105.1 hypothetical protein LPJ67_001357 [Coemansia sp. RSA 1938]KAJ1805191.1 hypothetical protein LPJ77_004364 [Coemansia sp. RSA 2523]KAJ2182629.1 hypothetical protein GGF45_000679 [Coemansia sp. RSA 551]KAJ2254829.1 hypothetical protein GGH98_002206 [Coemansia sp. RSA 454]KAJ2269350.